MTIVYLIRHSVRMPLNCIETYNSNQSGTLKNEKIILSVLGEKRAEILSNEKELQNIDVVYTSNCVRTIQTAKYILEKQNLNVNIDDRFDERRIGLINDHAVSDWFERQYYDENYKTVNGESQKDVKERFKEAFDEVIKNHKDKRIAIFSHGYAITFFLLNYCKIKNIIGRRLVYEYNGKIILDKELNAPEVFKLILDDNNNVINIELIEFDDLPYNHGV